MWRDGVARALYCSFRSRSITMSAARLSRYARHRCRRSRRYLPADAPALRSGLFFCDFILGSGRNRRHLGHRNHYVPRPCSRLLLRQGNQFIANPRRYHPSSVFAAGGHMTGKLVAALFTRQRSHIVAVRVFAALGLSVIALSLLDSFPGRLFRPY
jgi:hypothetical protein